MTHRPIRAVVVALLALTAYSAPAAGKPLKVFILAGQSNMQGHASVSTFDSLADDPKTAPLLKQMRDKDGKPRACEKVRITSVGCQGDAYTDLREQTGKLTVGYGAFGVEGKRIGPEYTFGITMEDRLGDPVLLIKTSWGGRSLHTDFRSPSAGPFVLAKETQKLWDENPKGAHGIPKAEDRPKFHADKVAATGVYYREMIAHTKKVLKDIKRVVPDYDEKQGYELAGFVWFQGFNDYVGFSEYPDREKPGGYDQYADLLAHFIRDVRKDLSAPKLPFVIGVMGIDGLKGDKKAPMMHFRAAQRKPLALDEFKGNVFAVETAAFWDDDLDALAQRKERLYDKLEQGFRKATPKPTEPEKEAARKKALDEEFKPEELKRLKAGVSNGGYHYLGAAKILAPIGQAFAEALLDPAKKVGSGSSNKPVKVFVLAGQSNMEGTGFIQADLKRNEGKGSLEYVAKQPATADKFKHLLGKDGKWAVRDDVWIHYLDRKGKLTVGFGAKDDRIGPELGFGHVIGEAYEEPVLLVKLAWGGKSLAKDFRPPSAGGEVGPFYKEVVDRTKAVLKDLKKEFPEFGDRKYELAGFGWHQGWNDRVNQAFNDEYEKNMAHFIRDIRKDLGVKNLPFVIAETGMTGPEEKHPRALSLMKAQAAVAEYEEFKGTVAFVKTQSFWRKEEESPTKQGYHWNTNAETYYLIGEAMGTAMKKLCEPKPAK
jgi:Carbohydrate esterase, sialic acid-specific acetylesterase